MYRLALYCVNIVLKKASVGAQCLAEHFKMLNIEYAGALWLPARLELLTQ